MPEPTAAEKIAKYTPPLPKQHRDASVNVDAMILAQKNPPPDAPPAPTPPATPPAAPPAPAGDPPQSAAPQPAPPTPPAPPAPTDAEHQLRSLQGRYENQVRINTEQANRLTELERTIASMRSAGQQPAPTAAPAPPARLITPEEEQEFGPELLDVAGRRAREVFTPELSAFDLRMKALENRVEGVTTITAQTAKERLYSDLASAVPNWQTINYMPEFKQWLSAADPYSGRTRQELLSEAFSGLQGNRVIHFFKGFLEATGTPPAPATPAPTPATPAPPAAPSLEALAAPGRARSDPQQLPAEKPTYTSAWFAAFMHAKLNGGWKGREAEADAIERDVFLAQREGRFIP